jgi:hypothetical protein
MKHYISSVEGEWVEVLPVNLTEEQKSILESEDKVAKKQLSELIKSQKQGPVDEIKKSELDRFYNIVKPKLKEGDSYELISISLSKKAKNIFTGILNYRINKEHKQVRF